MFAELAVRALNEDVQGEFDILGKNTTINEIATTLTDLLNIDSDRIILGTNNLYESIIEPHNEINCMKLGYIDKTSLVRGLTQTIKWWELQRFNKEKV